MIKWFCFILTLFSTIVMESQNWGSITDGKFYEQIERVLYDSVHNQLLVSSKFLNRVGNLSVRGVCSWNGSKWDSLSGGINTHDKALNPNAPGAALTACIPYNGKLLAGGYFSSIGYINTKSLALWDGVKWDSLPKKAFSQTKTVVVSGFLKKGNLLYITGNFDTIAGQKATGLATWDGMNYQPILLSVDPYYNGLTSIVEYQNEIYIAGGMFAGGVGDVLKYDGNNWISTTGGGFTGPYSGARQLIVYNGELYAAGYFEMALGNPGNIIVKWDGNQWHDVGFGSVGSYVEINKMLVYQNKLWLFGGFYDVAGISTSMCAVYDGTKWCSMKDTLDNKIGTAAIFNDTIYIGGGFWKANSDSIPYVAKLKEPNLFNQCVNVVGLNELSLENHFSIYPNPTTSIININSEQNLQNSTIQITNTLGQTLLQMPFDEKVDISVLPEGMYFLSIENNNRKKTVKIIKQ